jgi:hypothetical protein
VPTSATDQWLVFQQLMDASQLDVYRVKLPGSTPEAVLTGPASEGAADLSPDGRLLAYISDESGQFEAYVDRFPDGGEKTAITTMGGALALGWHADCRQLLVVTSRGVWLYDIVSGAGIAVRGGRLLTYSLRRDFVAGDITSDLQRSLVSVVEEGGLRRSITHVTGWTPR